LTGCLQKPLLSLLTVEVVHTRSIQETLLPSPLIRNAAGSALFPTAGADIEAPERKPYAFGAAVFQCVHAEQIVSHLVFLLHIGPVANELCGPAIGCAKTVYSLFFNIPV